MILCVDATVAAKWHLNEVSAEDSLCLLLSRHPIVVPDILDAQVGQALAYRIRKHELTVAEAERILKNLQALPLHRVPVSKLAQNALQVASATNRSFNESLYLALAVQHETRLVTADRTWYQLLQTGRSKHLVRWVADAAREVREESAAPPGR